MTRWFMHLDTYRGVKLHFERTLESGMAQYLLNSVDQMIEEVECARRAKALSRPPQWKMHTKSLPHLSQ